MFLPLTPFAVCRKEMCMFSIFIIVYIPPSPTGSLPTGEGGGRGRFNNTSNPY